MLYVVATPIGNLDEITFRAVDVLNKVDYILCEDTRTSKVLLNKYNIKTKCVSYHKFNENFKIESVVSDLKNGKDIALISDAGMPCVSDPGNLLINALIKEDLKYTVVSGACATINAFVLSGFDAPFTFVGFLPEKNTLKNNLLKEVSSYKSTLIFYVSPHNLTDTFELLSKTLGDRPCAIVREISKMFEEVTFSTLNQGFLGTLKGEFVLVVKGNENKKNPMCELSIEEHLKHYINQGLTKNEAIKKVCEDRKLKKNEVYKIAINL